MTAPLERVLEQDVPTVGTAGNDESTVVAAAPFGGVVESVTYIPEAAVTGADTNSRTVSLVNKGADGAGTTVVASLAFTAGTNAVAYDERTVTLSATAANRDVHADDTLQWQSTHVGTGITDPGGLVRVTINRG